jgi:cyclase
MMGMLRATAAAAILVLISLTAQAAQPADPYTHTFEELAPGVWTGVRGNSSLFPVMGTSTFVIGDAGVVVFDGGGAALMSERLMAKIAELTDKPITHVVVSHWHGDHHFGIWRIVEEFPGVQVIAHPFTRAAFLGQTMDYLKKQGTAMATLLPYFTELLASGKDKDGEILTEANLAQLRYLISHADLLDAEHKRYAAVLPTTTFEDRMTIFNGSQEIQLLHLGDANTEGDVILWLPQHQIVATGDVVVGPTPYAFNTNPKKWADTLRAINQLNYRILIPGHGDIQRDRALVDLTIEALDSIAAQTDDFIARGMSKEAAAAQLDFSAFDQRFTGGDPMIERYYQAWFVQPLRASAWRAANGEVMVKLEPEPEAGAGAEDNGAE